MTQLIICLILFLGGVIFLAHSITTLVVLPDKEEVKINGTLVIIGAICTLLVFAGFLIMSFEKFNQKQPIEKYEKVEFEVYKKINNK